MRVFLPKRNIRMNCICLSLILRKEMGCRRRIGAFPDVFVFDLIVYDLRQIIRYFPIPILELYIGDNTWKYSINIHHEHMCHVSWMYGSWIHVSLMNEGLDMDMEVLVICIGHTARAAEGRERQSQEAPRPESRRNSNKMLGPSRANSSSCERQGEGRQRERGEE